MSCHDLGHSFEETCNGTLRVHYIKPPFPRSFDSILFAHIRRIHLTSQKKGYDVFFVDQLATCVPFLRLIGDVLVVFYCHFPDKLLATGAFVERDVRWAWRRGCIGFRWAGWKDLRQDFFLCSLNL